MRAILEVFMDRNMPNNYKDLLPALYGIAPKITDGSSEKKYKDQAKRIFDAADETKINKFSWSYQYCRSTEESKKEAQVISKICNDNAVVAHLIDCEKEWAGVWGAPIIAHPDQNALAFIEEFRKHNTSTQLFWNGLSASESGPRKLCTEDVMVQCEGYCPMNYSSLKQNSSAVKRTVKWRKSVPHLALYPTLDIKADYAEIQKFVSYVNPIDGITMWHGNGAAPYLEPFVNWLKTQP